MRRKGLLVLTVIALAAFLAAPALAAGADGEDTDTRLVSAKVVEVTPDHISVIARSGVEHVIAADDADTLVTREGKVVSLQDLRQGDTVTVELDAASPLKFAARIQISTRADDVASATP